MRALLISVSTAEMGKSIKQLVVSARTLCKCLGFKCLGREANDCCRFISAPRSNKNFAFFLYMLLHLIKTPGKEHLVFVFLLTESITFESLEQNLATVTPHKQVLIQTDKAYSICGSLLPVEANLQSWGSLELHNDLAISSEGMFLGL